MIDPQLIEQLVQDASRIQQEGQQKVVISQQLFQQIQAALENYNIQKHQVDGMTAQRIQAQGFAAGQDLVELMVPSNILDQYGKPTPKMNASIVNIPGTRRKKLLAHLKKHGRKYGAGAAVAGIAGLATAAHVKGEKKNAAKRNKAIRKQLDNSGVNYYQSNEQTIEFANEDENRGKFGKGFRDLDPNVQGATVAGATAGAAGLTGAMALRKQGGEAPKTKTGKFLKRILPGGMEADLKAFTKPKGVKASKTKTAAEKLASMRKRVGINTAKSLGYGALGGAALGGIAAHIARESSKKKDK